MRALKMLIVISLFLPGCKEKADDKIKFLKNFPESGTILIGEIVDINIIGYGRLYIMDTNLIILNTQTENIFEIYDTNTLEKLVEFGKIGDGPDEFLQPDVTSQEIVVKKNNRKYLEIYDMERRRLSFIDPIGAINDSNFRIPHENLPEIDFFVRQVVHKNDSLLYFMPENLGRFMIYDYKTKDVKTIPFLPELGIPIQEENKWIIYHSVFAINQKLNKIAAAPMLLGQLDFFNLKGQYLHSTNFDDFNNYREQLIQDNVTNTTLKRNIISIRKYKKHIFALNVEWSFEDSRNKKNPERSKIMQFDWEGNLLQEFILDKYIGSFAYDEINHSFFVFCPDDEEHPIWRYHLPDSL